VMRTQGNGFDLGVSVAGRRAIITDPDVLPIWARYAKLRTRFLPEILRSERSYERTGMPVMRHLSLIYPNDPAAVRREDQYMFGDSILVAPVIRPGQTERTAYLPEGRWVDLWRSASADLGSIRRPRIVNGGREVTVPAPLDELPMFVKLGSDLELLPRGGPSWKQAAAKGKSRRSLLAFGGKRIRIDGPRPRRYVVQWTRSSRPRRLLLDGERVPFAYERGVIRAQVTTRDGLLKVR